MAQLADEPLGTRVRVSLLEGVLPQCVVRLAAHDDVLGDHEQAVGQGKHRVLCSPSRGTAPGAGCQRWLLQVCGGLGGRDEGRAQPDGALAGAAAALAAGARVGARREPRPRRARGSAGEARQVGADLGHQQVGRPLRDGGKRVQPRHHLRRSVWLVARLPDLRVKARPGRLQALDLRQPRGERAALLRMEMALQLAACSACSNGGRCLRRCPLARPAKTAGSASPASSAARIARRDTPMTALTTAASVRVVLSSSF